MRTNKYHYKITFVSACVAIVRLGFNYIYKILAQVSSISSHRQLPFAKQCEQNKIINFVEIDYMHLSLSTLPEPNHFKPSAPAHHPPASTSTITSAPNTTPRPHIAKVSLHDHVLFIQHLRDASPITVQDNLRLIKRHLHGPFCSEDFADFFERAAACLDEEEVDEDEFEYVPEDEEEVVLWGFVVLIWGKLAYSF